MTGTSHSRFLLAALMTTCWGFPDCGGCELGGLRDDDDDDVGADGDADADADGDTCNPLICNDEGEMCCDTGGGGEVCVGTTTNFQHCGGCGEACSPDSATLCLGGECLCGPGGAPCEGTLEDMCCHVAGGAQCIDLRSNGGACGACNNNCIALTVEDESDRCIDGSCSCGVGGAVCVGADFDTCCPDEGDDASCHNLLEDFDNCGGCALADRSDVLPHVRGDGILDSHYACSPEVSNICLAGTCICGLEMAPCLGGRASTCCAPDDPLDADLAVCANLDTSALHCGTCNNPCGEGEVCMNGVCVD